MIQDDPDAGGLPEAGCLTAVERAVRRRQQLDDAVRAQGRRRHGVVVWDSKGSSGTDSSATSIQGQRYAPNGFPVGGEFQVNAYTTNYQRFPSVAMDAGGDFVVVWVSEDAGGADRGIHGQRFASDGTTVGGEFQVDTYTASNQVMLPARRPCADRVGAKLAVAHNRAPLRASAKKKEGRNELRLAPLLAASGSQLSTRAPPMQLRVPVLPEQTPSPQVVGTEAMPSSTVPLQFGHPPRAEDAHAPTADYPLAGPSDT